MHIGFLISSLGGGGAERVVATVANRLSERGYKIYLYIFSEDVVAYKINESILIRVCGENGRSARLIRIMHRTRNLSKYLCQDNPELLFVFMADAVPYALAACAGKACKVVGSERANPAMHNKMTQWIIKYISPFCNGYVFQTEGAKSFYPPKTQGKGIVIPNSAPVYEKARIKADAICICSIGRLSTDKDFETLITAYSIFEKKYKNSTLTIFGEGNRKEVLISLAQCLGISDKVIFRGFVHNILDEINQFSMFVFSSLSEGMPNALIEAMSVGLPCISTDCPYGPSDLIQNGVNGWLVPVGNAAIMAEKMEWVIQNPDAAEKMGEKARNIQKENSVEKIIDQYVKYIERVLNNKA